ncbi:UDP-N-acetylglucosamine 2-epimerase [Lysobacter xinjiangensis]|uniref:UDP-N-acetylglucosamine 2-epimerase (non-hydrolyzing) n=1 Tax=Cognatilysobacter xinjiangensis TaxID=546892 RepID=A0ABQ3BZR5_9GAMM|nr:UDP-N-acetylglucosamine 2-epimerase (non-hydrolyzing) [Lysobacter xinjiangensis]GGZ59279.1 UDP-N-acetylglucosamine 2-epimerase [Lysobacter xinjiangensis]
MHDILLVSGTRPEIIKLAPVYHALKRRPWARPAWLHTGQHDAMATPILDGFGISPDYVFERDGATLARFGARCREWLSDVMSARPWSGVIVQGDTESTFLGALAGFYHRVPVSHVEAGLRTHNLDRPFPEEGLRQMISRIARHQFAPTARARDMLLREAVPADCVQVTGNTVVDAQKWLIEERGLRRRVGGRGHILVTMHRRENWGDEVAQVFGAIADIAMCYPDVDVLFPVHLNPLIQAPAHAILGGLPNVRLVAPLDYLGMQQALIDAWLVLSDSGGLQEEAPTYGVPLLVLREETERPEAVGAGCARVVGTDRARIVAQVQELWEEETAYAAMRRAGNPFGDGLASERIADTLAASFGITDAAVGVAA